MVERALQRFVSHQTDIPVDLSHRSADDHHAAAVLNCQRALFEVREKRLRARLYPFGRAGNVSGARSAERSAEQTMNISIEEKVWLSHILYPLIRRPPPR